MNSRAIPGGGNQDNIGRGNLVRWCVDWTEIKPIIAESLEVPDDATTLTSKLREGMRWPDGPPFTADDMMFW
ncbi:ABC transporter substrate-binding protein [Primorskyibacter sedentarius]|uniref:ABC transporter substrate-binding protein n=1 Tax=Primorskyibacter sedentarius TaxID=745311 RepID=UPI00104645C5|nr:ABC transporter substrate-binding protein [Primorskyibacter sedentarius]